MGRSYHGAALLDRSPQPWELGLLLANDSLPSPDREWSWVHVSLPAEYIPDHFRGTWKLLLFSLVISQLYWWWWDWKRCLRLHLLLPQDYCTPWSPWKFRWESNRSGRFFGWHWDDWWMESNPCQRYSYLVFEFHHERTNHWRWDSRNLGRDPSRLRIRFYLQAVTVGWRWSTLCTNRLQLPPMD